MSKARDDTLIKKSIKQGKINGYWTMQGEERAKAVIPAGGAAGERRPRPPPRGTIPRPVAAGVFAVTVVVGGREDGVGPTTDDYNLKRYHPRWPMHCPLSPEGNC